MIGVHIPKDKTFKKSVETVHKKLNINAFQIFVRNPRALKLVQFKEKEAEECKKYIIENNLFLVSHSTYLLNSATKDNWNDKVASAINELLYSEKVGCVGSVFHVGKHLKQSVEEGIENMFQFITEVIDELQRLNSKSIYILETCASCGTELLSDLTDFGNFYKRFTEKQRENLKVCIDTCHVFSAGYSLKTDNDANLLIQIIENNIGWNNVAVIHLNDSKKDVGCCVDRHENLCVGCIGSMDDGGFKRFVKHCYELRVPMVLETPHDDDKMYETYQTDLEKVYEWIK